MPPPPPPHASPVPAASPAAALRAGAGFAVRVGGGGLWACRTWPPPDDSQWVVSARHREPIGPWIRSSRTVGFGAALFSNQSMNQERNGESYSNDYHRLRPPPSCLLCSSPSPLSSSPTSSGHRAKKGQSFSVAKKGGVFIRGSNSRPMSAAGRGRVSIVPNTSPSSHVIGVSEPLTKLI